ncbi:MAG: hypothetical protein IPN57_08980 [Ignavibacteria bacterium]|nr:hypothetical protein [Ignavibacteria bacterium]
MNILTFANIPSSINVQIIGLPVSVAAPPVIGDSNELNFCCLKLSGMNQDHSRIEFHFRSSEGQSCKSQNPSDNYFEYTL